jgi:acyl carrier protein
VTLHDHLQDLFRTVFMDDGLMLTDQTTAGDVPGWDSVTHINLMFAIEEAFGVSFAGNELAEFKNIGEMKAFLEKQTGGRWAA